MKRQMKFPRPRDQALQPGKKAAPRSGRALSQKRVSKGPGTAAAPAGMPAVKGHAAATRQEPAGLWALASAGSSAKAAAAVAEGLRLNAIDDLRQQLVDSEIDELVIPRRTYNHRRLRGMRLTPDESDRALRVARLIKAAIQTFGKAEKAMGWMRDPHPLFDHRPPLALAATEAGARLVENSLARLAWGAAL